MNETPKNREWVKNAAIVFLAVILVLTFFSNTIMNRSLPEVATQNVVDGAIVSKVRGSGTVTANGNNQVKMEKTRVIRAVLVKAGQEVQAGDVLFTLGEGSSDEIEAAEKEIRNLQNSYNRQAVSGSIYSFATDERQLDNKLDAWINAQDKLLEIEAKIDHAAETDTDLAGAIERVEIAEILKKAAEEQYNADLEEKQQYLDQVKRDAEAETQRQIAEAKSDLEGKESYQRDQYDVYVGMINVLSGYEEDLSNTQGVIYTKESDRSADTAGKEALNTEKTYLYKDIEDLKKEIEVLWAEYNNPETSEERKEEILLEIAQKEDVITADENRLIVVEAEITRLEGEISSIDSQLVTLKSDEEKYKQSIIDQKEAIESQFADPPSDQSEAIKELKERISELEAEGASKEIIDEAIEALNNVSNLTYEEACKKYDAAVLQRDTILERINKQLNTEYQKALAAEEAAEDAYLTALESLDYKQAQRAQSQAQTGIDMNATMQELEVAKKKLAELQGTDGENITAKVAGTVTSVECSAGDKKMKDDILCTIEVPDQGYTLSFSATNEQASRLRIGDQATVSNFYWGNEVTATLSSIKTDPKNPQNNKLLTFDLEGNVTSGSQLTISVGQKSANYDLIIPSSAIRSDSNGSFVLKVEAKNSPLGNRYIAKRVPVEVLASDDNNSAVTAELQYGDYVITTSSAPIKNGSMVRLANAS